MRLDNNHLADTLLLKTPGWARVGLTAPDPRMRHVAAHELERAIIDEVECARPEPHPGQLGLDI